MNKDRLISDIIKITCLLYDAQALENSPKRTIQHNGQYYDRKELVNKAVLALEVVKDELQLVGFCSRYDNAKRWEGFLDSF